MTDMNSRRAYWTFERHKAILIRSLFGSVLSVTSVAKKSWDFGLGIWDLVGLNFLRRPGQDQKEFFLLGSGWYFRMVISSIAFWSALSVSYLNF